MFGLIAVVGLLWLSERWHWFAFNQHKGYTVLVAVAVAAGTLLAMLAGFAVAAIFGRRFQFGISSLLVLSVAVALPCGWLAADMRRAAAHRDAVKAIRSGGEVQYAVVNDAVHDPTAWCEAPTPLWLRELLGDDFFRNAWYACATDDSVMVRLKDVPELKSLSLGVPPRYDRHPLSGRVTDASLKHIEGLIQIERLCFHGSDAAFTDAGLVHLEPLVRLRALWFDQVPITDRGLTPLVQKLPRLEEITLYGTAVTEDGADRLRRSLPKCQITLASKALDRL
jgi:hypothetical protein